MEVARDRGKGGTTGQVYACVETARAGGNALYVVAHQAQRRYVMDMLVRLGGQADHWARLAKFGRGRVDVVTPADRDKLLGLSLNRLEVDHAARSILGEAGSVVIDEMVVALGPALADRWRADPTPRT